MLNKFFPRVVASIVLTLTCFNGFAQHKDATILERCHAAYLAIESALWTGHEEGLDSDCRTTLKRASRNVTEAGVDIAAEYVAAYSELSEAIARLTYVDAIHCVKSDLTPIKNELIELQNWVIGQGFKKK